MHGWFSVQLKNDVDAVRTAMAKHFGDKTVALRNVKPNNPLPQEDDIMIDVSKLTTKELVEKFNELSPDAPVKRFASRAAGEKRLTALLAETKDSVRAAAVSASWKDEAVAAKRSVRHFVVVNGKEYRSVRKAFEELGLPIGEHIKFRMELKAVGTIERYGFSWKAVEL